MSSSGTTAQSRPWDELHVWCFLCLIAFLLSGGGEGMTGMTASLLRVCLTRTSFCPVFLVGCVGFFLTDEDLGN